MFFSIEGKSRNNRRSLKRSIKTFRERLELFNRRELTEVSIFEDEDMYREMKFKTIEDVHAIVFTTLTKMGKNLDLYFFDSGENLTYTCPKKCGTKIVFSYIKESEFKYMFKESEFKCPNKQHLQGQRVLPWIYRNDNAIYIFLGICFVIFHFLYQLVHTFCACALCAIYIFLGMRFIIFHFISSCTCALSEKEKENICQ